MRSPPGPSVDVGDRGHWDEDAELARLFHSHDDRAERTLRQQFAD
jgi:hypothetical protein